MSSGLSYKLAEVFGLAREVPKTYVERQTVDARFLQDITRDKHIVVHGSSKQGKTCLRKYHLNDEDHIIVQCTRDVTKPKLYEMILKNAGVHMEVTHTSTSGSASTVKGTGEVGGSIPFFATAKVTTGIDKVSNDQTQNVAKEFTIDLNDPNDVVRVLASNGFEKFIVLEDFHYLDDEIQRSLAFDLKVFHETSQIVFIIVGVWLEANKLIMYNGDLSGRISTIDADDWNEVSLLSVIETGERLLNVRFSPEVRQEILAGCQSNVGLVQEMCNRLCEDAGVHQTQSNLHEISGTSSVRGLYAEIAATQSARYLNFLTRFAEGLSESQLEMYKWVAWVVIHATTAELRSGLRTNTIFQRIAERHPSGTSLRQNNVTQALERVEKVQFKHKLQPLVFDFSNGRLRIVDANFILFLQTQDKHALCEVIGVV